MVNTNETAFKWGGAREGAGRKAGIKTQARRWEEENPNAYAELMDTLYARAQGRSSIECPYCHKGFNDPWLGDSEAAKYVIDRIKGKPKAVTGMDAEDREALNAATLVKLFQMMDEHKKLEQTPQRLLNYGGNDAIEQEEG